VTGAVMGIDPGVSGGVVVLNEYGGVLFLEPIRSRYTYGDVVDVVKRGWGDMKRHQSGMCYLEKVGHIGKKDGRKGLFTFGKITGILAGSVLMAGAQLVEVPPAVWQSKMECLTGGNKDISKQRAIVLFPAWKKQITHATADALLIAEYGRRRLYGALDVSHLAL